MVTNAICGTVLLGLLLVISASAPAQQNFELYQKGLERDQNEQGRRDRMEQMNKDMKSLDRSQQSQEPVTIPADPPQFELQGPPPINLQRK